MRRREVVARCLDVSGAGRLLRRVGTWPGVLVLTYHRFGDRAATRLDRASVSASVDGFAKHLELLARETEVIRPEELPAAWRGRGRRVLITVDDGYRDAYEAAYPLLRAHGLSATFFLAVGYLDRPRVPWWDEIAWMVQTSPRSSLPPTAWLREPLSLRASERQRAITLLTDVYKSLPAARTDDYLAHLAEVTMSGRAPADLADGLWMTWDMAREMVAGGMAVGGHTVSHPVLARLPREEQAREIRGCADRLLAETGRRMRLFSYPVGRRDAFDEDTRECLREAGVELAFSLYGPGPRGDRLDPFDIQRTSVWGSMSPAAFAALLTLPGRFARW